MKPSWYETTTQSDYNNMSFGNTSTISYTSRGPSIDSQPEGSGSKYDEFSFPTRRVVEEEIAGGSAAPPVDRTLKPRTKPRSSESATDVNYQNKELQPRLPVKIQPKQSFKRRPS